MLWNGESVADAGIPLASVLILGTAEWDAPIATNQHYVARELSRTADVTFVESLGLRRPTLRRDDVARMASRVRRAFAGQPAQAHRPRPERTRVVSPLVVPVHRAPTRPLNRALLRRATSAWLHGPGPRVLWTFTPVTYGLEAAADIVVYHCVDLLGTVPGVDSVAVERGERRLAGQTPLAVATSTAVADHLAALGFPRVIRLPNVADVAVFAAASRPASERRRAVLFSGNLTAHKLDVALLESIASAHELVLAGPVAAGFEAPPRRPEPPGARHVGTLPPDGLADLAGTCAVGLIPYALNDYTRGVSPLKCFEYLASGLAVLSTRLPAVEELARDNRHVLAADPADFATRLAELLDDVTDARIAERRASAATQGWSERGRVLRELLAGELANGRQ
jgi:glycosyltransferase involved in cell wall biosynthesis